MRHRIVAILAVLFLLSACDSIDSMTEGFAHTQAVSASLEKTTGLKSVVGFNWNNGSLTSVNVNFDGVPEKASLQEVAAESRKAVLSEFKQRPKTIVISFSLAP